MAVITACVAGGAMAIAAGGSLIAGHQQKQAAKGYRNDAERKAGEIATLEANRQSIPNPYSNVKDLSGMAVDLSSLTSNLSGLAKDQSGKMTNPFENLGVATQAAKMQVEETDKALANTLDILKSTGASAGGATALAQAALDSKKGVAASIESQEANNEKLKAEGASKLQDAKLEEEKRIQNLQIQQSEKVESAKIGEASRLQNLKINEAGRMQQTDIEAQKFKYGEQESRDIAQLNRLAGQEAGSKAAQMQAKSNQSAAYAAGIGAVGGIAGAAVSLAGKGA